jgi:hypothetical protein
MYHTKINFGVTRSIIGNEFSCNTQQRRKSWSHVACHKDGIFFSKRYVASELILVHAICCKSRRGHKMWQRKMKKRYSISPPYPWLTLRCHINIEKHRPLLLYLHWSTSFETFGWCNIHVATFKTLESCILLHLIKLCPKYHNS